jgi:hypothetical protein
MSLLHNRQPKAKAVRPVHGVAKWLAPMGFTGIGILAINGVAYVVMRLSSGAGFQLEKSGQDKDGPDRTVYDICTETDPWTCDCPDAIYCPERPGGCKHVAALRAALKAAGEQ